MGLGIAVASQLGDQSWPGFPLGHRNSARREALYTQRAVQILMGSAQSQPPRRMCSLASPWASFPG